MFTVAPVVSFSKAALNTYLVDFQEERYEEFYGDDWALNPLDEQSILNMEEFEARKVLPNLIKEIEELKKELPVKIGYLLHYSQRYSEMGKVYFTAIEKAYDWNPSYQSREYTTPLHHNEINMRYSYLKKSWYIGKNKILDKDKGNYSLHIGNDFFAISSEFFEEIEEILKGFNK